MPYEDPMMSPAYDSVAMPAAADDLISELSLKTLNSQQKERLANMLSQSETDEFDIHKEIKSQYVLIQAIRADLLNPNGTMREGMEPKEIQTIIGLFNSFMNLYLRSMERLDRDKELSQIEAAVRKAMEEAPADIQDTFLRTLEGYLESN